MPTTRVQEASRKFDWQWVFYFDNICKQSGFCLSKSHEKISRKFTEAFILNRAFLFSAEKYYIVWILKNVSLKFSANNLVMQISL